jgi:hypothetical protein
MSKEELLTDVKNLLYRRTDDVERLQKVIGDTERQRIKTLGEELEDLRGPPGSWWTWWIHQEKSKQTPEPC